MSWKRYKRRFLIISQFSLFPKYYFCGVINMLYFVGFRAFCSIAFAFLLVFISQINCCSVGLKPPSESGKYHNEDPLSLPTEGRLKEQPTNKTVDFICEPHQLFHNETKACYENELVVKSTKTVQDKKRAPCGELQRYYARAQGHAFGVCKCIRDDNPCISQLDFHRPVLSWPNANRCYFAYQQGPCKRGEWLVLNKNTLQSECSPNPCLNMPLERVSKELRPYYTSPETDIFHFLRNGTCYQTFTRAYCQADQYVRFIRTDPVPKCLPRTSEFGIGCPFVGTTAVLPCPQGHKLVGSDCSPIADFE